MGFFNKKRAKAMLTREYVCPECGSCMEFENEMEDTLVCNHCGHSMDSDMYGFENGETFEDLYPTKEELLGYDDENDLGDEIYEEVCNELED